MCLAYLEVGCWEEWLWYILLTLPSRRFLPYGPLLPFTSLPSLCHCPLFPHFCICLLLPSGREPSISSDTRTDSSTESYPYKHSHHESVVSHFSSDSQGTVIYNVENDSMSQSSRDTGRDLHSGPCLPDSVSAWESSKKKKLGQVWNVCHAKGERHRTSVIEWDKKKQHNSEWTMMFHCIYAHQQQHINKDHCNVIIDVIIYSEICFFLALLLIPVLLLVPPLNPCDLVFCHVLMPCFVPSEGLWEKVHIFWVRDTWSSPCLVSWWNASLFVITSSMQRTFLKSVNL